MPRANPSLFDKSYFIAKYLPGQGNNKTRAAILGQKYHEIALSPALLAAYIAKISLLGCE
jgi:hypothetical protein